MLRTSVLTRSERITDALLMTAEWTTLLTCQVNGCVSHDGSVDHSPYMPNLGTTSEVQPLQGTTVPSCQECEKLSLTRPTRTGYRMSSRTTMEWLRAQNC